MYVAAFIFKMLFFFNSFFKKDCCILVLTATVFPMQSLHATLKYESLISLCFVCCCIFFFFLSVCSLHQQSPGVTGRCWDAEPSRMCSLSCHMLCLYLFMHFLLANHLGSEQDPEPWLGPWCLIKCLSHSWAFASFDKGTLPPQLPFICH